MTDDSEYDLFITEFPKKGYKLVDYLQGRVYFALLDQMRLMSTSGMEPKEMKQIILTKITEIIDHFEPKKELENC